MLSPFLARGLSPLLPPQLQDANIIISLEMCDPCFNVLKRFCCSQPLPPPPPPWYQQSLFPTWNPLVLFPLAFASGVACGFTGTKAYRWLRSFRVGDLANAFVLMNTGVFLAVVLANNAGLIDWLSPSFSREGASRASSNTTEIAHQKTPSCCCSTSRALYSDYRPAHCTESPRPLHNYPLGFCVFGHDLQLLDMPLLQSHMLCFYVDTLTALVLAWLARQHQGVTHPSPSPSMP